MTCSARVNRVSQKTVTEVEKWIDALGEIYWKRFVTALILITDLFFHKGLKSETPNIIGRSCVQAVQAVFRFVTF